MIAELAWPVVALVGIAVAAKLVLVLLGKLDIGKAWAERVEKLDAKLSAVDAWGTRTGDQVIKLNEWSSKMTARMEALERPPPSPQAVRR